MENVTDKYKKIGFDNELYLQEQTQYIRERTAQFGNKLYLEFGGKLTDDFHASRTLPGYDPNIKLRLLQQMKDQLEIIICIYAGDIERRKIRADFGISYEQSTLKLIDDLREFELEIKGVVITRYEAHPAVIQFQRLLENHNIPVYKHRKIHGYPFDVEYIVSEQGYGSNSFIETSKPIVVVTGPGPASGKMATCLSQLYHENKNGVSAGYAKFETFPIWNLPLKHPVNLAYEAATADLGDFNQIDPFHLEAHNVQAINYNRDIATFPVLQQILMKILGEGQKYQSPTDMGVNRAGFAIIDDAVVHQAAVEEIIRRYFTYHCDYAIGRVDKPTIDRINGLLKFLGVSPTDRAVVLPAREAATDGQNRGKGHNKIFCGAAIALYDGTIITGTNSSLMNAPSAVILNAIKHLAHIPKKIHLLSPNILESIGDLKKSLQDSSSVSLNLDETLITLSISAITNPTAQEALSQLKQLKNCEIHLTHMPTPGDDAGLRRLGVHLTSDPVFGGKNLFSF